jgi:hypothetical protein
MLEDNDFNSQQSTLNSQPSLGPKARRQFNSATIVPHQDKNIDSAMVPHYCSDKARVEDAVLASRAIGSGALLLCASRQALLFVV